MEQSSIYSWHVGYWVPGTEKRGLTLGQFSVKILTILQRIADTFEVGFEWLKYGDEKKHISPVNKKLIEWLNDNQEVRDALWKQMREAE